MQQVLVLLIALLLVPLAALRAKRGSPKVPRFGKLVGDFFQALEKSRALVSKAWN